MSKKVFLILAAAIFILGFSGILVFLKTQKSESLVSPLPEEGKSTEAVQEGLLLYEDEAGFSFQYPQGLGIVEKDISDPNTYSSLELLSKNHPTEKMVVKITDTAFPTIDKWLKENPQEGNLVSEKEISLSGMKGKIFQYKNPSKNLILVIDSGILYYLEVPDFDFWRNAFETVSSTFKLTEEQTSSEKTSSAVIEEEEETIE